MAVPRAARHATEPFPVALQPAQRVLPSAYRREACTMAGELKLNDLGACPTGEHSFTYRQCGFVGCVDLRVWAKAKRYKFRLEESYKAEDNAHVKGDGRWFVEILCQNGLIYPYGGATLLAYAKAGVAGRVAELGADIQPHQNDGKARVFKFPVERLDQVAAILKPRKRRTVTLTPEQVETRRETLRRAREARKSLSPGRANQNLTADQPV